MNEQTRLSDTMYLVRVIHLSDGTFKCTMNMGGGRQTVTATSLETGVKEVVNKSIEALKQSEEMPPPEYA